MGPGTVGPDTCGDARRPEEASTAVLGAMAERRQHVTGTVTSLMMQTALSPSTRHIF